MGRRYPTNRSIFIVTSDIDAKLKAETAEAEAICAATIAEAERVLALTTGPAIERWRAEFLRRIDALNRR